MLDKDFQGNVSAAYTSAFQAVLVDVDPESGRVVVRKVASASRRGPALNPAAAEGQVHGGIHMGLGYALSERLVVERGQVVTQTFMDYAVLKATTCGDRGPPDRVRRRRRTVRRQGLGESGVNPRRGRGPQRDQGRDRRPMQRVARPHPSASWRGWGRRSVVGC